MRQAARQQFDSAQRLEQEQQREQQRRQLPAAPGECLLASQPFEPWGGVEWFIQLFICCCLASSAVCTILPFLASHTEL